MNGHPLEDLFPGADFVMYEDHTLGEVEFTPGGNMTATDTLMSGTNITIKTAAGGQTDKRFGFYAEQQKTGIWQGGTRILHRYRAVNRTSGETIEANDGIILTSPAGPSHGSSPPGSMDYVFAFPHLKRDTQYEGDLNG